MNTQTIENTENINASALPATPRPLAGSAFSAAYQRRLAEIQAVPEEQLVPFTLDLSTAVTTVRGALPEILAHREEMRKLVGLDQRLIDGLEDYALAAAEANALYDVAIPPREDIAALNQEALALRERFRDDVVALAGRGLIDRARLTPFKGLVGYKNVAFELVDYVTLLWEAWPEIQGKTAVTLEELEKAKQLGEHLTLLAGLRDQAPAVAAEAARVRKQALALLVRSYDEVRRALSFLRWREDDGDSIAPSLYTRSRKRADQEPEPPSPGATAPEQAASTAPAGTTHAAPAASGAPAAAHAAVEPGMPGGSPFVS